MNNNNALTPRQYGMMIVAVVVTAYMLYISIKGMREEARKKSGYEIQGAGSKKDTAKWIPLSILIVGIIATGVAVSRSNKPAKN